MRKPSRLPVIIRRIKKDGELIAFFPSVPWDRRDMTMTSYSRVGQHGGASRAFYRNDTEAPDMGSPDVVSFLRHLRGLYETEPDPIALILRTRLCSAYFRRLEKNK